MPNIREINAPADTGIRPDDRAQESLANSGRRIAQLYSTAGEAKASIGRSARGAIEDVGATAVKYMDNREISAGAKDFATLMAGLDAEWNKRASTADPNDPSTAQKFLEEVVEPRLEGMRSGFNTERSTQFAESQIQHLRTHFVSKTSADMATLSGVAAKSNINTLTNQLSNAAISDPSSLPTSLKMVEASIGAMVESSPTLRGVDAGRLKVELTDAAQAAIVKAAAIGAINANPEAGLKQFSDPKYSKYISGAELKQLEQQAKAVERATRVDENYKLRNQELMKQETSNRATDEYLQKLYSDDPKDRASISAAAAASDFRLTTTARKQMIDIINRETKPETAAAISNAQATDLISRIRAPEGDQNRITDLDPVYKAYTDGKLSKADLKFVREEFQSMRTPDGAELGAQQDEFIKGFKSSITHANSLLGKLDPAGDQKLYEFTRNVQRKVSEYRRAGKDPRDLFDPDKPDYLGRQAAISQYQKPLKESLEFIAGKLRSNMEATPPSAPAPPKATRMVGDVPVPAVLGGIADLQFNKATMQWRDRATGKIYDRKGGEIE